MTWNVDTASIKAPSTSTPGETRRVLIVSAGANHSVALLSGGQVCSWGRGEDGQLGHGDANDRDLPTIVTALDGCGVSAINCGADHTTARSDSTRTVYSWGWGDFGRLGHGNSSDLFLPHSIRVLQGLQIKQMACGDSHCLAISTDGEVYSWGRNQNGQLGLGHHDDSLRPQKVPTFQGVEVKMVAAGAEHTVAITASGKLYGWGWGRYGNLGLGDQKDRAVPAEVTTLNREKMKMVACGWRHTIVVSESGNIYSYGWSKYGQLGHGTFQDLLVPHQVLVLNDRRIENIAGGWRHSMAIDQNGLLFAWGWNKFGQVGCGNTIDQNIPQLVSGLSHERVVQVACGWRHTVATTLRGNVYSWGRGTSGQLGHGEALDRCTPKMIELLSADGYGCRQIASSRATSLPASIFVLPSERYAVVPDETLGVSARRLTQNTFDEPFVAMESESSSSMGADASVPDTDTARVRIGT